MRVGFDLVDLEQETCVPGLLAKHLSRDKSPAFVLRVAQRMTEAWLLADRDGMADFLHISRDLMPLNPDDETHSKRTLIALARKSKKSVIIKTLVPEKGLSAMVGKDCTPTMKRFVEEHWDIRRASDHSPSLKRALTALESLRSAAIPNLV